MIVRRTKGTSRRAFLRGAAGTTLSLPFLASLWPEESQAQSAISPVGLFTIVQACGTASYGWWPDTGPGALTSASFPSGHSFESLADYRDRLLFIRGLDNVPHLGGCDHHRVFASLLSAQSHRTSSAGNAGNTDTIDTLVARISDPGSTPFVLLGGRPNGSRYQTATHQAGDPIFGIRTPADAFNVIAGIVGGDSEQEAEQARRVERGSSIMDYVFGELCELRRRRLSQADRHKLEAYTEALRAVENDLHKAAAATCPTPLDDYSNYADTPTAPTQVAHYSEMLVDIGVLAAACGFRQAVTMYMGGEAPTTDWTFLGVTCSDHHGLSHHGCDGSSSAGFNTIADNDMHKVDVWHAQHLFRRAVSQLASLQGEGGDMLSRCGVLFINGLRDGRSHDHRNIPIVLAGGMGGYFKQGEMVQLQGSTISSDQCNGNVESCRPHNSFLAMLGRAAGAEIDHFGMNELPTVEHNELRP